MSDPKENVYRGLKVHSGSSGLCARELSAKCSQDSKHAMRGNVREARQQALGKANNSKVDGTAEVAGHRRRNFGTPSFKPIHRASQCRNTEGAARRNNLRYRA